MPGARGFRVVFSQFAYVYGVFSVPKCRQGPPTMIGSSIQRLVGLRWAVMDAACELEGFAWGIEYVSAEIKAKRK